MTLQQQREFVRDVFPGVVTCITTYVMVTAFRKFKDYFPGELFAAMLAGTGTRGENTDSSMHLCFFLFNFSTCLSWACLGKL